MEIKTHNIALQRGFNSGEKPPPLKTGVSHKLCESDFHCILSSKLRIGLEPASDWHTVHFLSSSNAAIYRDFKIASSVGNSLLAPVSSPLG